MKTSDNTFPSVQCFAPPALTDDELLAAIDGEADSSIYSHLDRCAFCSAQLADIRDMEAALDRVMYRADCPPAEQLADYTMRLLMTSDAELIDRHIERCALCREEVTLLRATIAPKDLPSADPHGETIHARLKRLFQPLVGAQVRVLLPSRPPAYSGIKGVRQRSREYESDAITVMLSVQKTENQLKLNGSILDGERPGLWRGGYAEFAGVTRGQRVYAAAIDEDETLTLEGIAPGTYNANFYATEGTILRLHEIELAP
jgi:hypothetical protein